MSMIQDIKAFWGWSGIDPDEIIAVNDFGNLIIKDHDNKFWRLCPEDVYCEVVADSLDKYNELIIDSEFINDWNMSIMFDEAIESVGPLVEGCYYYMEVPGVIDGEYGGANIKTAQLSEIIKFFGELGMQIKDLPEGAEVKFKPMK